MAQPPGQGRRDRPAGRREARGRGQLTGSPHAHCLPGPDLPDLHDLGSFLREQRQNAKLSLRQLSELAGVSNPYLSQIERGLKKPSAEILKELARGLEVSAETLYVRAGILDEKPVPAYEGPSVLEAIAKDPALTDRQRAVLVDVYTSFTTTAQPAPTTTSKEK